MSLKLLNHGLHLGIQVGPPTCTSPGDSLPVNPESPVLQPRSSPAATFDSVLGLPSYIVVRIVEHDSTNHSWPQSWLCWTRLQHKTLSAFWTTRSTQPATSGPPRWYDDLIGLPSTILNAHVKDVVGIEVVVLQSAVPMEQVGCHPIGLPRRCYPCHRPSPSKHWMSVPGCLSHRSPRLEPSGGMVVLRSLSRSPRHQQSSNIGKGVTSNSSKSYTVKILPCGLRPALQHCIPLLHQG